MALKNVSKISIAKEKQIIINYESIYSTPLNYEKWVEYIENHNDYYTWYENSIDGIETKENIDLIPERFQERILKRLNKRTANAEFEQKEKYFKVILEFFDDSNYIRVTTTKPTIERLEKLLDLANYLDALLLINGKKIVDKIFLETQKTHKDV